VRLFPRAAYNEGRQIAIWAAQAEPTRCTSPPATIASLASRRSCCRDEHADATFLHFAAAVKKGGAGAVIAVGRLGDPTMATEAVATARTDFIALGRALVADPQWVEKLRRDEPIRRCLACNTCINEMRGGARIGCVVNGRGRETLFADARPPRGEQIAVIGAGPAG